MYGSVGASNCKLFILNLTINRLVALHPNSSTEYLPLHHGRRKKKNWREISKMRSESVMDHIQLKRCRKFDSVRTTDSIAAETARDRKYY